MFGNPEIIYQKMQLKWKARETANCAMIKGNHCPRWPLERLSHKDVMGKILLQLLALELDRAHKIQTTLKPLS